MLKYVAKISMDIFPSVLATIIGAYIVNHYINARPATDTPAAIASPAQPKKDGKPADLANLPAPGVKAKGISEKNVSEKAAVEKLSVEKVEAKSSEAKSSEAKSAEPKSFEPKSLEAKAAEAPAESTPRGHQVSREKTLAKATPAPTVAAPAIAAPAAEANPAQPTQDANDLARAAIERLRKSPEKSPELAPRETARAAEPPHVQDAPRVANAVPEPLRPLPPPITVSTPGPEAYSPSAPPYTASVGSDDSNRLTPPADIPVPVVVAPPLDLRADASGSTPPRKTNVADEMLSNVKSMFHSVLPKSVTPD